MNKKSFNIRFGTIVSTLLFQGCMYLFAQTQVGGTDSPIYYKNGNVGVGTISPSAKLHINNGDNSYGAILAQSTETPFQLYTKTLTTQPIEVASFRIGLKYNTDENNGFITFYRGPSTGGGFLGFSTNGVERMRINAKGYVGINTHDPRYQLDVQGAVRSFSTVANSDAEALIKASYTFDENAYNRSARIELGTADTKGGNYYGKVWSIESLSTSSWGNAPEFRINNGDNTFFRVNNLGNIGVGIAPSSTNKLEVNGTIRAKEIKVDAVNWPDYVFSDQYNLKTIKEIEQYIKEHKHLPNIPSAKEMEANGVDLAEMNKLLLQKIEELTLYLIDLELEKEKEKTARETIETRLSHIESLLKQK